MNCPYGFYREYPLSAACGGTSPIGKGKRLADNVTNHALSAGTARRNEITPDFFHLTTMLSQGLFH